MILNLDYCYFIPCFNALNCLILFILFQFADYPIEKLMVAVTAFNPIDLARIIRDDTSARPHRCQTSLIKTLYCLLNIRCNNTAYMPLIEE